MLDKYQICPSSGNTFKHSWRIFFPKIERWLTFRCWQSSRTGATAEGATAAVAVAVPAATTTVTTANIVILTDLLFPFRLRAEEVRPFSLSLRRRRRWRRRGWRPPRPTARSPGEAHDDGRGHGRGLLLTHRKVLKEELCGGKAK